MRADPPELARKHRRVQHALQAHAAVASPGPARLDTDESAAESAPTAMVLHTSTSLAWLLDGARVHVSLAGPPVAQAVVHPEGVALGVHANEAERLVEEEIGLTAVEALGISVHPVRWDRPLTPLDWLPRELADPRLLLNEEDAAPQMQAARASLLPAERQRYGRLCVESATAATEALAAASPKQTEQDLAAHVSRCLMARGAEPLVILVAGEGRVHRRHPLPTWAPLGGRALLVVCARRHGMVANLSRWVEFAPHPDTADHTTIAAVESDILDSLVPGRSYQDVLAAVRQSYPRHGFDADEWTRHHQGGAAGYAGRDPRFTTTVPGQVEEGQAFAFNPSALGAKIEDTVWLGPSGIEILTQDPQWPTHVVNGRLRPQPLRL